jgi:glycine cleavage system H protein
MTNGALKISQDHVWVQTNGEGAQVGISDFAAEALGTIIYVELPEVGDEVTRGDSFAAVESGKASVELPAPISGHVLKDKSRHLWQGLDSRPSNKGRRGT